MELKKKTKKDKRQKIQQNETEDNDNDGNGNNNYDDDDSTRSNSGVDGAVDASMSNLGVNDNNDNLLMRQRRTQSFL